MTGRFQVPYTRAQGRKIETWTFHLPDDTIEIDVHLHSDSAGTIFKASSKHASVAGKGWSGTDIKKLAAEVEADLKIICGELSADRWKPIYILHVDPDRNEHNGNTFASLRIRAEPARLDIQTPRGNDGRRRIEKDGSVTAVQERSPADEAHIVGRIKFDSDGSRTVIEDTAQTRAAIEAMQKTLEGFGRLLAQRTSPARANPEDLPTPDDLVDLMREAASNASS